MGAVGLAVGQSMCSSILTLPHLLLQEEGKDLSVNTCHSVMSIGVPKFNSNISILLVNRKTTANFMRRSLSLKHIHAFCIVSSL